MKAVIVPPSGGAPDVMSIGEISTPTAKPGQILVKTAYTALNRADTLQRKGLYPPPPGAPSTLGLELSGIVAAIHEEDEEELKRKGIQVGDRVACLVGGGSYAEYVLLEAPLALSIPPSISLKLAASIPEAWLTAYQLLYFVGQLKKEDVVLIHAGASGVGLAAIQLVREIGAIPLATASTSKLPLLKEMGAEAAVDYTKGPFAEEVKEAAKTINGGGEGGVDLLLDCVGGSYFTQNLDVLGLGGRYVLYGSMGGVKSEIDLRQVMRKQLSITGTTLRGRPLDYKEALVKAFWSKDRIEKFQNGSLKSNIHATLDWSQVVEAHQMMEGNVNSGKILLAVDPSLDQ